MFSLKRKTLNKKEAGEETTVATIYSKYSSIASDNRNELVVVVADIPLQ